jgi:hypothetical protein
MHFNVRHYTSYGDEGFTLKMTTERLQHVREVLIALFNTRM